MTKIRSLLPIVFVLISCSSGDDASESSYIDSDSEILYLNNEIERLNFKIENIEGSIARLNDRIESIQLQSEDIENQNMINNLQSPQMNPQELFIQPQNSSSMGDMNLVEDDFEVSATQPDKKEYFQNLLQKQIESEELNSQEEN